MAVGHGVVVVCVRERFVSLKRELTAVGVLHAREHVEGWEFRTPRCGCERTDLFFWEQLHS